MIERYQEKKKDKPFTQVRVYKRVEEAVRSSFEAFFSTANMVVLFQENHGVQNDDQLGRRGVLK